MVWNPLCREQKEPYYSSSHKISNLPIFIKIALQFKPASDNTKNSPDTLTAYILRNSAKNKLCIVSSLFQTENAMKLAALALIVGFMYGGKCLVSPTGLLHAPRS